MQDNKDTMPSEKSVGINSSPRQRIAVVDPLPSVPSSSSTSASCGHCCYHAKDRFRWHHLVTVAVIAGIFPSSVFFGFLYATQLPCDCRLVAKQVDRLLREQFQASVYDLSSLHDLSSAEIIASSTRHRASPADVSHPSTRRRMRRQSSGGKQKGKQTRDQQAKTTGKPRTGSNKKGGTGRNSCNAAGIHLEFSIPALDQQMTDRLRRINGSTESVEYGEISQNGFKPYADRHNGTRYSFRNWIPAKWFNSSFVFKFHSNRGTIQVLQSGLYYVYSQIRFYHTRPCSYALMVNAETVLFKCIDGTAGEPLWQFSNCHIGGVAALKADDQLWLKDMYGDSRFLDYYVHLDPALGASSFWGAIHLGQL